MTQSPESPVEPWREEFRGPTLQEISEALGGRLQPAVAPNGESVDHDCAFRHMVRDVAQALAVPPGKDDNYDGGEIFDRLVEAANLWRAKHDWPEITS